MSAMSHRYKALGPLKNFASAAIWWIASIGLFVGVWEFCWYMKWANPMLFPPPHIFLQTPSERQPYTRNGNDTNTIINTEEVPAAKGAGLLSFARDVADEVATSGLSFDVREGSRRNRRRVSLNLVELNDFGSLSLGEQFYLADM